MVKTYKNITVTLKANASGELKTLEGKEYRVYPVTMLVEGVLHPVNAENPELALFAEFKRSFQGWNGRPLTLNHPKVNGIPVSANSPDVWEKYRIGYVYNANVDEERKSLNGEAWFELSKVNEVEGAQEILDALDEGTEIEISTGLFAETEEVQGIYEGEQYFGIWRNIVPDHLAVLSLGSKGACSLEDGCGIRASEEESDMSQECDCKKPKGLSAVIDNIEGLKPNEESFESKKEALNIALQRILGSEYAYVIQVFEDYFVYEVYQENMFKTYKRTYSFGEDGSITINNDAEEVRIRLEVVPINVEVNDMTANEEIQETKFNSISEAMEAMDDSVRQQIEVALQFFNDARNELINELKDNEFCVYTEDELKELDMDRLKDLKRRFNEIAEKAEAKSKVNAAPEHPNDIVDKETKTNEGNENDVPPVVRLSELFAKK